MLPHCPSSTPTQWLLIRRFIGQEIIKKFGPPSKLLTDYRIEFVSQDTQAYLHSKKIKHITTTPYCPQPNNCVEHLNGVLFSALRKLSGKKPLSWVKHLLMALLMARSCINRDIHFSPLKKSTVTNLKSNINLKDSS